MHKNDMKQVLYIFIARRVCTKPKTATYVGTPAVTFLIMLIMLLNV